MKRRRQTTLLEALTAVVPRHDERNPVVAFVGAGGKTSAMFVLADEACRELGARVMVTTTTMIRDPRLEDGRRCDRILLDPHLRSSAGNEEWKGYPRRPGPTRANAHAAGGELTVAASEELTGPGKLRGIHPSWAEGMASEFDLVLVEADGARGRSIKAPSGTEPVLPWGTDLVVGCIGLDALGARMDRATVHRSEIFGPLVGCPEDGRIGPAHVLALVRSPAGLFKGRPRPACSALILNKVDATTQDRLEELVTLLDDQRPDLAILLVCSLRGGANPLVDVVELGTAAVASGEQA